MEGVACAWEAAADERALFLRCYQMMSANTLRAVEQDVFQDSAWVDRLLHRFADYYFDALDVYETTPDAAPVVWRLTHDVTRRGDAWPLQKLLLGVNAHINYDLALAICDVLQSEWAQLAPVQKAQRYADHCHINQIIGGTIDAVQDQVLHRAMPAMRAVDVLLGALDERLISTLLTRWRESVWRNAAALMGEPDSVVRSQRVGRLEEEACRTARWICSDAGRGRFGG